MLVNFVTCITIKTSPGAIWRSMVKSNIHFGVAKIRLESEYFRYNNRRTFLVESKAEPNPIKKNYKVN